MSAARNASGSYSGASNDASQNSSNERNPRACGALLVDAATPPRARRRRASSRRAGLPPRPRLVVARPIAHRPRAARERLADRDVDDADRHAFSSAHFAATYSGEYVGERPERGCGRPVGAIAEDRDRRPRLGVDEHGDELRVASAGPSTSTGAGRTSSRNAREHGAGARRVVAHREEVRRRSSGPSGSIRSDSRALRGGVELLPEPGRALGYRLAILAEHLDIVAGLLRDRADERSRDSSAVTSAPKCCARIAAVEEHADGLRGREHRRRRLDLGLPVLGHPRAELLEHRHEELRELGRRLDADLVVAAELGFALRHDPDLLLDRRRPGW